MDHDQARQAERKDPPLSPEAVERIWKDFDQTKEVMRRYYGRPDTHGDGPTLRPQDDSHDDG